MSTALILEHLLETNPALIEKYNVFERSLPICSSKASRSKTFSAWPVTLIHAPLASTIGAIRRSRSEDHSQYCR
jgi:hypothetical protein